MKSWGENTKRDEIRKVFFGNSCRVSDSTNYTRLVRCQGRPPLPAVSSALKGSLIVPFLSIVLLKTKGRCTWRVHGRRSFSTGFA